jgi:hypothetical protein
MLAVRAELEKKNVVTSIGCLGLEKDAGGRMHKRTHRGTHRNSIAVYSSWS